MVIDSGLLCLPRKMSGIMKVFRRPSKLVTRQLEIALSEASGQGHTNICRLLLNTGHVRVSDENIMNACRCSGSVSTVSFLVDEYRGDWRQIRNDYDTLLTAAARRGHRDVVMWLLEQGLPVSHRDSRGNTLLHFAVFRAWQDVVDSVLRKDISAVNMCNICAYSPCHLAAICGRKSLVISLMRNGVDMTLGTERGSKGLGSEGGETPLLLCRSWRPRAGHRTDVEKVIGVDESVTLGDISEYDSIIRLLEPQSAPCPPLQE